MTGRTVSHYHVQEKIGAGGMGEVYRASDTRLERVVALKVLPEAFAANSERMSRFDREAKVLASLNHPNIASIYGLEDSGKVRALVMELVEGPTLADRLKSGAMPLDEALPIARQIAEALEYAHERGIIHRDLKPSNVKVTPEGKAKVLDFGLAKALAGEASSSNLENSPTLSHLATQAGILLGTAAYMSPEQARGKRVDRRADIWAFGVVLFEMLAGERLFTGETISDTLAAVIRAEPDWSQLPPTTPPRVRELVRRCLQKDPKQRLQAIGDARIALEETQRGEEGAVIAGTLATAPTPAWRRGLPWLLVALLAVALAGELIVFLSKMRPPVSAARLSIALPAGLSFENGPTVNLAISTDGAQIAFVARDTGGSHQIWLRRLDNFSATPVPGTEGADTPFFSPDGQWLGFWANNHLGKVLLSGGFPQALCNSAGPYGATWASDGTIYFAEQLSGLFRVPDSGGERQQVAVPEKGKAEWGLIEPQILPGDQALLYIVFNGFSAEQSSVAALSLKTGERKILLRNAGSPRYFAPGYIVFGRSGTLWAVPFDAKRLQLTGTAAPLVSGVATHSGNIVEQFAVSENGVLAYAPGAEAGEQRSIVELDRKGHARTITTQIRSYEDLSLSPDGRRLAATIEGPEWNVWTYDLQRNTLTRLTFQGDNRDPRWSADGKSIVYTSLRNAEWRVYREAADGTGAEQQLFNSPEWTTASSFSPDGRYLAVFQQGSSPGTWILPLENGGNPYPFVKGPVSPYFPTFSPDGHWIAYESNESGRSEIYVQAFSGAGGKWQVSNEGGARPVWPRNDNEIFYMKGPKLMAVPVQISPAFSAGTPQLLFEGEFFTSGQYYDASADGQHFYFVKDLSGSSAPTQINVVLNWSSDLAHLTANKVPR